jgi:nucleoside-diphosphate-sugar epimerase
LNKRISILGCGWLGKHLAKDLVKHNYVVKGSTTTASKLNDLEAIGITPYLIDIKETDMNISDFLISDILIIPVTSKDIGAFRQLIHAIEQSIKLNKGPKKIIFISSTSVYNLNNTTVTENTPKKHIVLAEIEDLFFENNSFKTTILRFGGLFGYNRQPGNFFKTNKPIPNPEGYINFIHRDDCVNIIKNIIEQDVFGEVFNACAYSHPTRRDFYTNEFRKVGREEPTFDEDSANDFKIIDSSKLLNILGFEFKFGDLMGIN